MFKASTFFIACPIFFYEGLLLRMMMVMWQFSTLNLTIEVVDLNIAVHIKYFLEGTYSCGSEIYKTDEVEEWQN